MASSSEAVRVVGRYEILREIGRGGMAVVHLARQTELDRNVALKELSAFHATDASFAQRFLRESRMAGSLAHPNIVTVHDYFEWEGVPMIAMEYLQRGSLRPYVGHLTDEQAVGVFEGLLAGLAHAEQHSIVHRDLKPENLMVSGEGRVKIADFGIAKAGGAVTSMLTATGMTVGTPSYMAPEQAMAQKVGPWTDLYSVGCMAYEIFCGRVPFGPAETPMAILMMHVNTPPPSPHAARPDLDPKLAAWIESLLSKEPESRPPNATVAWEELEEIALDVLGPRWRRKARLVEMASSFSPTPEPLTPAPFESGLGPATPPPGEAAPAPESGFVTYGRPSADPAEPPAEPTPEPAPAVDEAAPEVVPDEPPAPIEDDKPVTADASAFVTFNPPPVGPPPELIAEPEPEPAAETPPPEPEEDTGRVPAGITIAPSAGVAPEPAAATAEAPPAAGRSRWLLAAGAIVVLAAVLGVVIGGAGSKDDSTSQSAGSTRELVSEQVALRVPSSWKKLDRAPDNAGMTFSDPVAAAPAGAPAGAAVTAGIVDAEGPSLLPAGFLQRLGSTPRPDGAVRLGSGAAYVYRGLLPGGASRLTIFTMPTASGVATVACSWPGSPPAAFDAACEQAATALRVRGVKPVALSPSRDYAAAISKAVGALDREREAGRAGLAAARTPAGQARVAGQLRDAYARSRREVGAIQPGPAEAPLQRAIRARLRKTSDAYGALASAARRHDRRAYARAASTVATAERDAAAAVSNLKTAGYGSARRNEVGP